jgi:hypothetical protein
MVEHVIHFGKKNIFNQLESKICIFIDFNGTTILKREVSQFVNQGLTMYVSKSMTFPTPHMGHSRHGLHANLLKRTMTYSNPGIRAQDGVAASIPNHYTLKKLRLKTILRLKMKQYKY